ncbi:hypothetical protein BRC67_03540 [Halobacteriales archaeon QH_3_68_24]|nr:MAG: hypothetical protein BRC67_03540 [Halobacteriales archaeon QH_3_68_24]
MVTLVEVGLLALAVIAVIVGYRVLKNAKALVVNAIVGVLVLALANFLGLGVQISLVTVLVCAVAGIPGAVLVILLSLLDVAFVAAVVPALA